MYDVVWNDGASAEIKNRACQPNKQKAKRNAVRVTITPKRPKQRTKQKTTKSRMTKKKKRDLFFTVHPYPVSEGQAATIASQGLLAPLLPSGGGRRRSRRPSFCFSFRLWVLGAAHSLRLGLLAPLLPLLRLLFKPPQKERSKGKDGYVSEFGEIEGCDRERGLGIMGLRIEGDSDDRGIVEK